MARSRETFYIQILSKYAEGENVPFNYFLVIDQLFKQLVEK